MKQIFTSLLFLLMLAATPLQAQMLPQKANPNNPQMIDRIVAVVNDGVILQSDLDQAMQTVMQQYAGHESELPPRNDVRRIHSSNLVVRSDPDHTGALALDAILTNTASFEQPWPKLRVQFSDLRGKPEAARVFSPTEYLGGEAAGTRLMPSNRPVHVSLLLVDPGPAAVNYQIDLLPTGS